MGNANAGRLMDGFGIQIEAFYPSSRTVRGIWVSGSFVKLSILFTLPRPINSASLLVLIKQIYSVYCVFKNNGRICPSFKLLCNLIFITFCPTVSRIGIERLVVAFRQLSEPPLRPSADMRRLKTGIFSEKCVVRRFRCCANVYLHKTI